MLFMHFELVFCQNQVKMPTLYFKMLPGVWQILTIYAHVRGGFEGLPYQIYPWCARGFESILVGVIQKLCR